MIHVNEFINATWVLHISTLLHCIVHEYYIFIYSYIYKTRSSGIRNNSKPVLTLISWNFKVDKSEFTKRIHIDGLKK